MNRIILLIFLSIGIISCESKQESPQNYFQDHPMPGITLIGQITFDQESLDFLTYRTSKSFWLATDKMPVQEGWTDSLHKRLEKYGFDLGMFDKDESAMLDETGYWILLGFAGQEGWEDGTLYERLLLAVRETGCQIEIEDIRFKEGEYVPPGETLVAPH